jgi:hypothetical protein
MALRLDESLHLHIDAYLLHFFDIVNRLFKAGGPPVDSFNASPMLDF